MTLPLIDACAAGDLDVLALAVSTAERAALRLACAPGTDDDLALTDTAVCLREVSAALVAGAQPLVHLDAVSRDDVADLIRAVLDGLTECLCRDGALVAPVVGRAAVALAEAYRLLTGRLPQ